MRSSFWQRAGCAKSFCVGHLLKRKAGSFLFPCDISFESAQTTKANSAVLGILSTSICGSVGGMRHQHASIEMLRFVIYSNCWKMLSHCIAASCYLQFCFYVNVAVKWTENTSMLLSLQHFFPQLESFFLVSHFGLQWLVDGVAHILTTSQTWHLKWSVLLSCCWCKMVIVSFFPVFMLSKQVTIHD